MEETRGSNPLGSTMNVSRIVLIYIVITSFFYLSRFVMFAHTQNVGIEHDSGWYLGVSRILAEKGMYASYTNTIADSEQPGAHPSIHGRYSVQDKEGYSYFPAGVTVGPGFIIPQAIVYYFFGVGDWQNRAVALLSFALLVPLLYWTTFRLGGIFALLLFQLWTWSFPQLFLNWAFEAYSEHLALLYMLSGYALLVKTQSHMRYLFSGILIGLSVLTKQIYLIGFFPVIIFLLWKYLHTKPERRLLLIYSLYFALGFVMPVLLFELYRFFVLFSRFGIQGYVAINKDLYLTMKCCGSGVVQFLENPFPLGFMWHKLFTWNNVGLHPVFILLITPILAMKLLHKNTSALYFLLICFFILYFGWFVVLSSTGFFRHAWPSIIVGFMVCSSLVTIVKHGARTLLVALAFFLFFVSPHSIWKLNLSNDSVNAIYTYQNKSSTPLFINFFLLRDQKNLKSFLEHKYINKRICYDETLLVAEMPVYLNRVFFPIQRCVMDDILIIGPYQKQLLIRDETYLPKLLRDRCAKTIFENNSYTLCLIK